MKVWKWLAAVLAALSLCGCGAGKDFDMTRTENLQLGVTTPEQALAMFGQPVSKNSTTIATIPPGPPPPSVFASAREPGSYGNFYYAYIDTTGAVFAGALSGVRPTRSLRLEFFNGKLVNYESSSSFQADSTNFDATKIAQIERGKTRQSDLAPLLGLPSGQAIFPAISARDGHVVVYNYSEDNLSARQRTTKFLAVYLDSSGVVRDIVSNSASNPLAQPAAAAAATPTIVPIFIPHGR